MRTADPLESASDSQSKSFCALNGLYCFKRNFQPTNVVANVSRRSHCPEPRCGFHQGRAAPDSAVYLQ